MSCETCSADVEMVKEEHKIVEVTVQDSSGAVVDISGWTLRATVASVADVALISKTSASGYVAVTDGPNGVFQIIFVKADTASIEPGLYRWDSWRTDTGLEAQLTRGDFILKRPATTLP